MSGKMTVMDFFTSGSASAWPYLSGCWETCARERWRACGMRSTVFADPFLLLKMRLQSDTVTIHPATARIVTRSVKCHTAPRFQPSIFLCFHYGYTSRLLSSSCHWVVNIVSGTGEDVLTVLTQQD